MRRLQAGHRGRPDEVLWRFLVGVGASLGVIIAVHSDLCCRSYHSALVSNPFSWDKAKL